VTAPLCVLCLGNPWHGDDGFGHHVFQRLQAEHVLPAGVTLVDAGVAGLNAMRWLDSCGKAVLVDAVRVVIGAEVGPVRAFTDALSPPLRTVVPTVAAMVAREVAIA
jgi:hydrogenase maturation protease